MTADYRLIKKLDALALKTVTHWRMVDGVLPVPFPLVVLADVDLAAYLSLWDSRGGLLRVLDAQKLSQKLAVGALRLAKAALYKRMKGFRGMMLAYWQGTKWMAALPLLPHAAAGAEEFLAPMEYASLLWSRLAPLPPPVPSVPPVLADGYDAADFARDFAELQRLWRVVDVARLEVRIAHGALWVYYEKMVSALMAYPHAARSRLALGTPLAETIPRTWPRRKPARSPDEVR